MRHLGMRRRAAPMALGLALALALGGCTDAGRAAHVAQMNRYLGMSETDLIRARGVPNRTVESGTHRFLAYETSHVDLWPPLPAFGFGRFGDYGGLFPARVMEWHCQTTFELSGGRVVAWRERGNNC